MEQDIINSERSLKVEQQKVVWYKKYLELIYKILITLLLGAIFSMVGIMLKSTIIVFPQQFKDINSGLVILRDNAAINLKEQKEINADVQSRISSGKDEYQLILLRLGIIDYKIGLTNRTLREKESASENINDTTNILIVKK